MPFWIQAIVAALLVCSGLLVFISAIGFLRLPDFFLRMHPPALAYTLGNWCVAAAAALHLSALHGRLALHPLLVPLLLAITVPITTLLLARVSLFRHRRSGADGGPAAPAASQNSAGEPPDAVGTLGSPKSGHDP